MEPRVEKIRFVQVGKGDFPFNRHPADVDSVRGELELPLWGVLCMIGLLQVAPRWRLPIRCYLEVGFLVMVMGHRLITE
jgi:hypothetical protein